MANERHKLPIRRPIEKNHKDGSQGFAAGSTQSVRQPGKIVVLKANMDKDIEMSDEVPSEVSVHTDMTCPNVKPRLRPSACRPNDLFPSVPSIAVQPPT